MSKQTARAILGHFKKKKKVIETATWRTEPLLSAHLVPHAIQIYPERFSVYSGCTSRFHKYLHFLEAMSFRPPLCFYLILDTLTSFEMAAHSSCSVKKREDTQSPGCSRRREMGKWR